MSSSTFATVALRADGNWSMTIRIPQGDWFESAPTTAHDSRCTPGPSAQDPPTSRNSRDWVSPAGTSPSFPRPALSHHPPGRTACSAARPEDEVILRNAVGNRRTINANPRSPRESAPAPGGCQRGKDCVFGGNPRVIDRRHTPMQAMLCPCWQSLLCFVCADNTRRRGGGTKHRTLPPSPHHLGARPVGGTSSVKASAEQATGSRSQSRSACLTPQWAVHERSGTRVPRKARRSSPWAVGLHFAELRIRARRSRPPAANRASSRVGPRERNHRQSCLGCRP